MADEAPPAAQAFRACGRHTDPVQECRQARTHAVTGRRVDCADGSCPYIGCVVRRPHVHCRGKLRVQHLERMRSAVQLQGDRCTLRLLQHLDQLRAADARVDGAPLA